MEISDSLDGIRDKRIKEMFILKDIAFCPQAKSFECTPSLINLSKLSHVPNKKKTKTSRSKCQKHQ